MPLPGIDAVQASADLERDLGGRARARRTRTPRRQGDRAGGAIGSPVAGTMVVAVVGGTVLLGVPSRRQCLLGRRALVDVAPGGEHRDADRDARQALHRAQR